MMASNSSIARLILVLSAAGFSSTFAWRSVEPLVGVLARDLGSDAHTVALLSTAFALPYALIQPILGPVGDAVGKERVMTACLAVLVVAVVACALAMDLRLLFGLRMVAGAAAGGVIPLALALMGDRVPMERRQVAIGRFLVAVILGQLSGSTFAGLIEGQVGWHGVFAINAARRHARLRRDAVRFRPEQPAPGRGGPSSGWRSRATARSSPTRGRGCCSRPSSSRRSRCSASSRTSRR